MFWGLLDGDFARAGRVGMKNWSMDLLKYQPFPELASALRKRTHAIMARWQQVVATTFPAANELTFNQIRNSLPETLMMMADALEAQEPHATKDLMDQATAHGEIRYDQNFRLGELMIEYGLLRPILIEELAGELERVVTIEEINAINMAIDVACRRGVVTYVNQQKAEISSLVEAQSKYLTYMSHDLRGELNGVLLLIEVLHRDLSADPKLGDTVNDLDMMRRSILDTVATMERFLYAERFRKGKVKVKRGLVNIKSVVDETINRFKHRASDKRLELCGEGGDGVAVTSDHELIRVILQNVLGNAIKYAKKGTVRIVAGMPDDPQFAARVSVVDEGPGMSAETIEKLFQPFARGETHGEAGMGLGLSIVRQAADLLGLKLTIDSKVGEGTRFHVDLPKSI